MLINRYGETEDKVQGYIDELTMNCNKISVKDLD